jgi:hypothetical protein
MFTSVERFMRFGTNWPTTPAAWEGMDDRSNLYAVCGREVSKMIPYFSVSLPPRCYIRNAVERCSFDGHLGEKASSELGKVWFGFV